MIKNDYYELKNMIAVANKLVKADIIIKNAKIINVFNEKIEQANIAIYKNKIAGIGDYEEGYDIIDAENCYVSPSFIDSHIHIESTKLTPYELSKALLPLGTTCIIADPHEIANVCGIEGIEFLINNSKSLPIDIFFMASSCVPATNFETNFKKLDSRYLRKLKKYTQILGLAEVMNYPAVINSEKSILQKIILFKDMIIDGHSPNLLGKELNAYISAGIYSDHECTTFDEAMEKLSKGMYIMMREGSVAKDLDNLAEIINDSTKNRILLCTDDKEPDDIIKEGHINYSINKLLKHKVSLPTAIKLATLNPCQFFGFKQRGGIAPGYYADLVIFKDLKSIKYVIKNGNIIFANNELKGEFFNNIIKKSSLKRITNTFKIDKFSKEDLKIINQNKKIRVIEIKENSLLTKQIHVEPFVKNGFVESDIKNDILKIVVLQRHHGYSKPTCGFIKGFGIKKGAFASSISHDSHNIVAIGENDDDLFLAIRHLININGGIVITKENSVIAELPLIYGGLISNMPLSEVTEKYNYLKKIIKEENLSCLNDPFMLLSFMTLPVIPEIKITDKGIFDVNKFCFVDLFLEKEKII